MIRLTIVIPIDYPSFLVPEALRRASSKNAPDLEQALVANMNRHVLSPLFRSVPNVVHEAPFRIGFSVSAKTLTTMKASSPETFELLLAALSSPEVFWVSTSTHQSFLEMYEPKLLHQHYQESAQGASALLALKPSGFYLPFYLNETQRSILKSIIAEPIWLHERDVSNFELYDSDSSDHRLDVSSQSCSIQDSKLIYDILRLPTQSAFFNPGHLLQKALADGKTHILLKPWQLPWEASAHEILGSLSHRMQRILELQSFDQSLESECNISPTGVPRQRGLSDPPTDRMSLVKAIVNLGIQAFTEWLDAPGEKDLMTLQHLCRFQFLDWMVLDNQRTVPSFVHGWHPLGHELYCQVAASISSLRTACSRPIRHDNQYDIKSSV